VKPVLQALVLAERVYQDITGKKIIAGTFNRVLFSRQSVVKEVTLPDATKRKMARGGMQGGSPFAYMSLTDVCDKARLILQFVNLSKNVVLFGTDVEVTCSDRLGTVEVVIGLPQLPIQEEGTYAFEVVCEGEILGSHRITAAELKFEEGA